MAGVGKTTLAIEVAHQLHEYFQDGVIWLNLDSSTESTESSTQRVLKIIGELLNVNVDSFRDATSRSEYLKAIVNMGHQYTLRLLHKYAR